MFTLRSRNIPRAFYKFAESWPFDVEILPNANSTELNPLEKERQLRVLSPLLSCIATSGNPQYHAIASLVAQKTEKIIEHALSTFVLIDKEQVSVLAILEDSANSKGHWSVEGYEAIKGLKKFAQKELTLTRLQSL